MIDTDTTKITLEECKAFIPVSLHKNISESFVESINDIGTLSHTVDAGEVFRELFKDAHTVLHEGKYKLEDYSNAALYLAHLRLGYNQTDAYKATFPDRVNEAIMNGSAPNDICKKASAYNKNKLVQAMTERTMAVDSILFASKRHKALGILDDIMSDESVSPATRVKAALGLAETLKQPEQTQAPVAIQQQETSSVKELMNNMQDLAQSMRENIANGGNILEIINTPLDSASKGDNNE